MTHCLGFEIPSPDLGNGLMLKKYFDQKPKTEVKNILIKNI